MTYDEKLKIRSIAQAHLSKGNTRIRVTLFEPCFLVMKKNDSGCMCVDFRALN